MIRNGLFVMLALYAFFPFNIYAKQSPVGLWRVSGEKSEDVAVHVSIVRGEGGQLSGKIVKLHNTPEDQRCIRCTGSLKNRPLLGLKVLWGLSPDGSKHSGGYVLDVETGGIHKAKIWLEDGTLKVRGYAGIFYRTRTWHRLNNHLQGLVQSSASR